jgi:hypothetical protein
MKKFGLFSLLAFILTLGGCTLLPPLTPLDKFTSSKVESPFFFLPPLNSKDFEDRRWILLAESQGINWYYDPYTLSEDEDGVVMFDAFTAPRLNHPSIALFNASITGPFRQKIDCFGNYQWSETFFADQYPPQETYVNPRNPNLEYGWIKIRPKSAMAYIRTRICGRKFLDDKNINYFLFQEGRMRASQTRPGPAVRTTPPGNIMAAQYFREYPAVDMGNGPGSSPQNPPLFYEVLNNEVFLVDPKKNIREMKISSYTLHQEFPKVADLVFKASCDAKTFSLSPVGKSAPLQELDAAADSLANVAFNRACGDHGVYMKLITQRGGR